MEVHRRRQKRVWPITPGTAFAFTIERRCLGARPRTICADRLVEGRQRTKRQVPGGQWPSHSSGLVTEPIANRTTQSCRDRLACQSSARDQRPGGTLSLGTSEPTSPVITTMTGSLYQAGGTVMMEDSMQLLNPKKAVVRYRLPPAQPRRGFQCDELR